MGSILTDIAVDYHEEKLEKKEIKKKIRKKLTENLYLNYTYYSAEASVNDSLKIANTWLKEKEIKNSLLELSKK